MILQWGTKFLINKNMTDKNVNGFRSEEQYEQALKTLKGIYEDYDFYGRDPFAVYYDADINLIEFYLDDYKINIYDTCIELEIITKGMTLVDCGIMNLCAKLSEDLDNGVFYEFFNNEEE